MALIGRGVALWGLLLAAILGSRLWPSPANATLIFDYSSNVDWGIHVYDIERNLAAPYLDHPRVRERQPTWSPDGSDLLYIDYRPSGDSALYRTGQADPLVTGFVPIWMFWGAEGRMLYWFADTQLGQLDLTTGQRSIHSLHDVTYIRHNEFAPVGTDDALVLASLPGDDFPKPYLLDLNTHTLRPVDNREVSCSQGTPQAVVPSPDGNQIALSCRFTSNLYLVDVATETRRVLVSEADLPGGTRFNLRWSRDGKQLLFRYIPNGQTDPATAVVEVATGTVQHTLGDVVPGYVDWMPSEVNYGR